VVKFACSRKSSITGILFTAIFYGCIPTVAAVAQAVDTSWLITSSTPLANMPPPNLPVATGLNSLAAGPYAVSSGDNSTTFGYSAVASGVNSSALSSTSVATGANGVAVGMLSRATGSSTTAIGNSSNASGNNAVALGVSSAASGVNTTAIGYQSTASAINSVAIGDGSVADAPNTVSFGLVGRERTLTNVAAGVNPTDGVNVSQLAALDNSVNTRISNAFATFANWQGTGGISSVAVGNNAIASGIGTIGIGQNAAATGTNSVALGTASSAANAVAVGTGTMATNNGAAFGNGASATGTNSSAFGSNAIATAPNAAAIGAGSVASQVNTISVGSVGNERRITNVAAGVSPTDAVNMQQFQGGMASVNSQFAAANSRIDAVDQQAARGIAATAALAPTIMPSQNGRTTVSASTGFYRGEAALSVGAAYRLNLSTPTVIFGSYANAAGVEHVGRVGVAMEF